MAILSLIWTRFSGYIIGALAILAAFGEAFRRGRKSGIEKMEREQAEAREKAIEQRKAIDDDVQNLGHADLDSRLNRWVRK